MKNNEFKKIVSSMKSFINGNIDSFFFEQALDEVENNQKDRGTWARSLALSEGDEIKAKSKYIQLRAEDLQNKQDIVKESQARLIVQEQEKEYELINDEKLEKAVDSATSTLGSVVGIYMLLGFAAIGLFVLTLFAGFEPSFLLTLFGGIILLSPYFIIKQLGKRPVTTFRESKKRVNLMFALTIVSSVALTIIGAVIIIFLIYKWIVFNKKTQYKYERKS